MSQDFQIPLSDELAEEIRSVQEDFLSYLRSLPAQVEPLVPRMVSPETTLSPGRLSVLAIPFWLGEKLGIPLEAQRQIARANFFGLLHFISQDNLADQELSEAERVSMVVCSTLFQEQMDQGYQVVFAPGSPFWAYMNKYWLEWASSMAWERQTGEDHAGGLRPSFSEQDLLQAARKAAPLKVCASGLALLASRPELITDLEQAVDLMHMVMQMGDDLADLEEDLASNRYNTLLSMMANKGTLEPNRRHGVDHVGWALFATSDDEEFFRYMDHITHECQSLLMRLGLPQWAELVGLTALQAIKLRDIHLQAVIPPDLNPIFEGIGLQEE